jgi:hypothetical protein
MQCVRHLQNYLQILQTNERPELGRQFEVANGLLWVLAETRSSSNSAHASAEDVLRYCPILDPGS